MKVSGGTRFVKPSTHLKIRENKHNYTNDPSRKILRVIKDIRIKKYSTERPIYLGETENRILSFANKNKIEVSSEGMYITSEQIAHTFRDIKVQNGIVIPAQSLISFYQNYKEMNLYYDKNKKNFVYTNGTEKFIVHPNYQIKVQDSQGKRLKKSVVNYITASTTNGLEFNQKNYIKI